MNENPAISFLGMGAVLIALIVAIAWTVLPFILFSRLKATEKLLTSIDLRLYYIQRHFQKEDAPTDQAPEGVTTPSGAD
jgi:hypothetical protein